MGRPTRNGNGWRARWTDESGKRQSQNCSTHAEALAVQRHKEAEVGEIKRGLRMPVLADKRFGELCDYWLAKRVPLKRDGSADVSIINRHLRPAFGNKLIRGLGVADTDQYQASRAHLDKKTVANHLTLLISMLNLAVELRWLERCPKIKKPKIQLCDVDYRYLRDHDEIQRFLLVAQTEGEDVYVLYATAIYTGMRAGEIATLKRASVDFKNRQIIVQSSFNGLTKAGRVRYVPILDPLLPILQAWLMKTLGPFVFPNGAANAHQPSARIFQETLHRVLTCAGLPKIQVKGKERWYIRFHDLRHTFASLWVMNGGDLFKLQKILGHASITMTQRYAHLAPNAYSSDYSRLGTQAPGSASATVLPLPARG